MTDELKKMLENAYEEEMKDHHKYIKMADEAEDHGVCGILKDIAHEELTHAKAISSILEEG